MKRDLDVIREILLEVESLGLDEKMRYDSATDSPEKIHNIYLLDDAGYIVSQYMNFAGGRRTIIIDRLTNNGHDFLDSIRDERVLAKVKTRLAEVGGQATLHVIKTLADQGVAEILKLGG